MIRPSIAGSAVGSTTGQGCFTCSTQIRTRQRRLLDLRLPGASRWQQLIAGVQGFGGHESVAQKSFYGYRQNVVRPVFLVDCAAFRTFAASGLAPHLGQATVSFLRS
jgi:hypothetical protein